MQAEMGTELTLKVAYLLLALIVAVVGTGKTKRDVMIRVCAALIFLVGLVESINTLLNQRVAEERAELQKSAGALIPGDHTPNLFSNWPEIPTNDLAELGNRSAIPSNHIAVFLGRVTLTTQSPSFVALRLFESNLVEIAQAHGKLFVTANVISEDGRFLAQIKSNSFHVNAPNVFYWDRPDRHTLSVFDQASTRVFHVEFLSPSAIRLAGIFRIPGKPPIVVDEEGVSFGPMSLQGVALNITNAPLFDFPASSKRKPGAFVQIIQGTNRWVPLAGDPAKGAYFRVRFDGAHATNPAFLHTGLIVVCTNCGDLFDIDEPNEAEQHTAAAHRK